MAVVDNFNAFQETAEAKQFNQPVTFYEVGQKKQCIPAYSTPHVQGL
jgi:hypothetical protein